MRKPIIIHDKKQIEMFFRKNTPLNTYQIGDLDDLFWNNTVWFGNIENGDLHAIALLYTGESLPVFIALSEQAELAYYKELLNDIAHLLPGNIYCHLTSGLGDSLTGFKLGHNGDYYKMLHKDAHMLFDFDTSCIFQLDINDLDKVRELYQEAYPDNWFNPEMLNTGLFFGYEQDNRLVSISGIHVYSEKYKVSALGNIATHPDYRGNNFATKTTAALCKKLHDKEIDITLNVHIENEPAINCYKKLGFDIIGEYEEWFANRKLEKST